MYGKITKISGWPPHTVTGRGAAAHKMDPQMIFHTKFFRRSSAHLLSREFELRVVQSLTNTRLRTPHIYIYIWHWSSDAHDMHAHAHTHTHLQTTHTHTYTHQQTILVFFFLIYIELQQPGREAPYRLKGTDNRGKYDTNAFLLSCLVWNGSGPDEAQAWIHLRVGCYTGWSSSCQPATLQPRNKSVRAPTR